MRPYAIEIDERFASLERRRASIKKGNNTQRKALKQSFGHSLAFTPEGTNLLETTQSQGEP